MTILESMRQGTESGWMKLVLVIVVLVFVFWGIGTGSAPTSQVVAEVNGDRITDTEYHKRMRSAMRAQDRSLSEEEQKALSNQVINQLILEEAIDQEAADLGIEVSDEEIARFILRYDVFKDEEGRFSVELYERYLQRMGMKRSNFEADLRQDLIRQKVRDLVMRSVDLPESALRSHWVRSETELTLDYVRVTALDFYDDIEPPQDELEAWIAEHAAEISDWYRGHYESRFHQPPRARVRMILLRSDSEGSEIETEIETETETETEIETEIETAKDAEDAALVERMATIRAEIEAGAAFGQMARKYSEDLNAINGGALGEVARDQLSKPIGEAIFGTEEQPLTEPGLRPVVATSRGIHLIEVEEMLPEESVSEEDAREEIALTLIREERAPQRAQTFAEELRQAWSQGALPSESLEEQEIELEQAGPVSLADARVPGIPDAPPPLLEDLESARTGVVLPQVYEGNGTWYVVRVAERDEPDPADFEAAKETLEAELLARRRVEFLQSWQDDLVARAEVVRNIRL